MKTDLAMIIFNIRTILAEAIKIQADTYWSLVANGHLKNHWYTEAHREQDYFLVKELRANHVVDDGMYNHGILTDWIIKLSQHYRLSPDDIDYVVDAIVAVR